MRNTTLSALLSTPVEKNELNPIPSHQADFLAIFCLTKKKYILKKLFWRAQQTALFRKKERNGKYVGKICIVYKAYKNEEDTSTTVINKIFEFKFCLQNKIL